jgi:hypothetical protein
VRRWLQDHSLSLAWAGYVAGSLGGWLVTGHWAGKDGIEMVNTFFQENIGQAVGTYLLIELTKVARERGSSQSR